jgi:hypothetical protein
VGVLVGIAEDAGHLDVRPADLGGDVAVEILGGDDGDRARVAGLGREGREQDEGDGGDQAAQGGLRGEYGRSQRAFRGALFGADVII